MNELCKGCKIVIQCNKHRNKEGYLVCSEGLHEEDNLTHQIQWRNLRKKTSQKEILYLETTPDPNESIWICRLVSPFPEKLKRMKDKSAPDQPSWSIYTFINKQLPTLYPSTQFRYRKGNFRLAGESKGGYILCHKDIFDKIKSSIESIKLEDGENYTIVPVEFRDKDIQAELEAIRIEMKEVK